jgi:hypothetical protein
MLCEKMCGSMALTIREEQMSVFVAERREAFVTQMMQHMREHFPDRTGAHQDDALSDQIRGAIERAKSYGLQSEKDLCRFLNLCGAYGWDFDSQPANEWMQQMLRDDAVSDPGERLRLVMHECKRRAQLEKENAERRRRWERDE